MHVCEAVWAEVDDSVLSRDPAISRQTGVIQGFSVTLVDRACDVPSEATGCESGVCAVPTRLRGFALTGCGWMQHCSAMPCWKGQRRPQAMDTVGTQSTDIYTLSNPHSLLYTSFPAYIHIQLVSQSSNSFSTLFYSITMWISMERSHQKLPHQNLTPHHLCPLKTLKIPLLHVNTYICMIYDKMQ